MATYGLGMRTFFWLFAASFLLAAQTPPPPDIDEFLANFGGKEPEWTTALQQAPVKLAKLDIVLQRAAEAAEAKDTVVFDAIVRDHHLVIEGDRVRVRVSADKSDAGSIRSLIEGHGGRIVSTFGEDSYAEIPLGSLDRVASSRLVTRVEPDEELATWKAPAAPLSDARAAGLLKTMQVDQLHAKGITGKNVRVGILEPLIGKNDNGEHGAEVASVVMAMAPDSERIRDDYLTEGDFIAAIDRMVANKVDIINHSATWPTYSRDGRNSLDKKVADAVAHNVLWVNAAGNHAKTHWSVTRKPYVGGVLEFARNLEKSPALAFQATTKKVSFYLVWDDQGGDPEHSTRPDGLVGLLFNVNSVIPVNLSEVMQAPSGKSYFHVNAPVVPGESYYLFLYTSSCMRETRVHVDWFDDNPIDHVQFYCPDTVVCHPPAEDSVLSPASAPASLTVGAVDLNSVSLAAGRYGEVPDYSSRGPTDEPRPKPEVAAYSHVQTDYIRGTLDGTSYSAPVVSGFAALLRNMLTPWTAQSAWSWIFASANWRPTGAFGPNVSGQGIVNASRVLQEINKPQTPHQLSLPMTSSLPAVTVRTLAALNETTAADAPFKVKLALGRTAYRIGDGIKVGFTSFADAYCGLIHQENGEYAVLTETSVHAGEKRFFPEGEDRTMRVTGPPGREEFVLVCSPEPLNWSDLDRQIIVTAVQTFDIEDN